MPNIKSAVKRMRQNAKRRGINRANRAAFRTTLKKVRGQLTENNFEAATQQLPETLSYIGKAASKGLIHKNKAARLASRLTRRINAGKQAESAS